MTRRTRSLEECVSRVRERLGDHWVVGAPLGLGKPNHLINALYRAACADPSIRLELFTALSLNPPKRARGLKQRFLEPFVERQFGNYPRLAYLRDLDRNEVPKNISISEFYLRSGSRLGEPHTQSHYVSSNYTHVARDMAARGINLLVQMVAVDSNQPNHYSLSCNPDVTLDLLAAAPREKLLVIAQVNADLPYMTGDAEVGAETFDLVLEGHPQRLFAVPRMPVSDADYMIGLHTSQLIRDGGTLQLGIGSLGDAVSYFSVLRHEHNGQYLQLLADAEADIRVGAGLREDWGGSGRFETGLYAASEMFTDGFLHLYRAGILRRRVYDHVGLQSMINRGLVQETLDGGTFDALWHGGLLPARLEEADLDWLKRFGIVDEKMSCDRDRITLPGAAAVVNDLSRTATRDALGDRARKRKLCGGAVLHAAFFLGSQWMYDTLNAMSEEERGRFRMTAVSRINQLYRGESLDRVQRLEGRFINTTMKMTLLGAAVSDQLGNGQVVSGVGGQYNFVAMAHALDRSRSLLMLRSHRGQGSDAVSNIVWEFPHATIPRHLRDLVVTEYGVADLRSASDEEVVRALICLADNRWQEELREAAVGAGKLTSHWRVPEPFAHNSPEWVGQVLRPWRDRGRISDFPFGSDFTPEEERLARALSWLEARSGTWRGRLSLFLASVRMPATDLFEYDAALRRMGLESPTTARQRLDRRLVGLAIQSTSASATTKRSG